MPALQTFAVGETPIPSAKLNAVVNALNGTNNTPIALSAVNDPVAFALTVKNADATNGRAVIVYAADGVTELLRVDKNGVKASRTGAVAERVLTTGEVASVTSAMLAGGITNSLLAADAPRANLLTNGGFEIWQQGDGPYTLNGVYGPDRWQLVLAGTDTLSVSKDTLNADTARGSWACAKCVFVLGTGAGGTALRQSLLLSDGYALRGQPVSVSVRVKTTVANAVRVALISSGAAPVTAYSSYHTGDGTYQTLTATATPPNDSGAVYVEPHFAASCTAYIDNATLVVGPVAADSVPLHPADDMARCQRYYELFGVPGSNDTVLGGYQAAGGTLYLYPRWRVKKAVTPTVTKVGTWLVSNANQPTMNVVSVDGLQAGVVIVSTGYGFTHNAAAGNTIESVANP